jgi:hypothetical protein
MSGKRGFALVDDVEAPAQTQAAPAMTAEQVYQVQQEAAQARAMLMLALKTFGQRFVIALSNLFSLLTVLSVWWLWMSVPHPGTNDLVGMGMYAVFILVVNYLVKRA